MLVHRGRHGGRWRYLRWRVHLRGSRAQDDPHGAGGIAWEVPSPGGGLAWRLCLAPDAWHLSELPCDSACPFRFSPDPQPDNPSLCVPLWAGSSHIRKLKRERTAANVDNMNRLPARSINNSCIHLTAAWPACTSPWLGSHVMHDGRGATPAGFRSCRPPLPRGSSRSELRA